MRLGFLTAPFPETPLMEVADWAAANDFQSPGDRLLAALGGCHATLRRHVAHRCREPVGRQAQEIRAEIESKGLAISGLGFYPNPLHPDEQVRRAGDRPHQAGDRRRRARWACRS